MTFAREITSRQTPISRADSVLVPAGSELRLASGVALLGKFDGEFARGSSTYAGTGTLGWNGDVESSRAFELSAW